MNPDLGSNNGNFSEVVIPFKKVFKNGSIEDMRQREANSYIDEDEESTVNLSFEKRKIGNTDESGVGDANPKL